MKNSLQSHEQFQNVLNYIFLTIASEQKITGAKNHQALIIALALWES